MNVWRFYVRFMRRRRTEFSNTVKVDGVLQIVCCSNDDTRIGGKASELVF